MAARRQFDVCSSTCAAVIRAAVPILPGTRDCVQWLMLSMSCRPLFVAEAEFKVAKYFTRVKKCMLVLYGAELLIVDVAALDAADSAAAAADISVAVLRLISYSEVSANCSR